MACAVLLAAGPALAQTLTMGKVNTGTPSLVADQNVPLQLDATGALKVTGGAGAATAANQSSAVTFVDQNATAVGASAPAVGTTRNIGSAPLLYTRFNGVFVANQSGTVRLDGSNDGTSWFSLASTSHPGGGSSVTVTAPVVFTNYRTVFVNGATAATVSVFSSYTAN
jgi:hypothetical protein